MLECNLNSPTSGWLGKQNCPVYANRQDVSYIYRARGTNNNSNTRDRRAGDPVINKITKPLAQSHWQKEIDRCCDFKSIRRLSLVITSDGERTVIAQILLAAASEPPTHRLK